MSKELQHGTPPGGASNQRLINQLIQLQDLIFTREQQQAASVGGRMSTLDEAIQSMMSDLPPDLATQFRKAIQKNGIGIAPVSNGVCSACGMALPVSQVPHVRAADSMHRCRNCARFLYVADGAPRRLGLRRSRGEPVQVGIARFSSPDLMLPDLESTDRDGAIGELCRKLQAEGFVDNGERLQEEALRRETIMTTAVDHGLAFPHVRGVEGGGLTLALGISRKGVRFSPGAKQLSRLIFLMVIPMAASAFYLKLLSGLTQSLREEDAREALLKPKTPEELWKALLKATRSTIA